MKRICLVLFILILLQCGYTATVTQSEATQLGTDFISSLGNSGFTFRSSEAYIGSHSQGDPDFYILRFEPQGFVLLAAEEQSIPILGYSLTNTFPEGNVPDHVRWYLDFYSRAMREIRANPDWAIDANWAAMRNGDFSGFEIQRDVSPLLNTTWDQDYPYNALCPSDVDGPGGHVYAGCVATAMGQMMKKWSYPTTGNYSHSYYASGYGTQTANFAGTTYNWAAMPNSISSFNQNIATLLYHCGVAVDMQYGAEASGAHSSDVRYAMVTYFGYNAAAQFRQASSYTASYWATMIRNDLDQGKPVYYSGQGPDGGHAFVLDGYQGSSNFHFNWGWSGYYNGYFALTNLNPGSYSFTQGQAALMNLYPQSQTSLTGIVSSEGVGLLDATISVVGTSYTAQTNPSGSYSISGLPAGTYQVTAQKTGYETSTQTTTLTAGQTTTLNFDLNMSVQFDPPTDLFASVSQNDVSLSWVSPAPPQDGEWISWSNNDVLDNSIGTGDVSTFDVAHMYDATDLAAYQGGYLTRVKFLPSYQDCIYTVKVWTDGTATSPGSLVYSSVAQNVVAGEWNMHVLVTPIPIPDTRLWIGYEVNTQGGYPAGCDSGPQVEGKGNLMNFGGWTTLAQISSILSYNWLIQGLVTFNSSFKNIQLQELSESPRSTPTGTLVARPIAFPRPHRSLTGYRIYRDGNLIESINNPDIVTYQDSNLPNGNYSYGVTACYGQDESSPATIQVTVSWQIAPAIFTDGFENHPDFSLTMPPWTLIDQDLSSTYGFSDVTFPNSEAEMAYIVFNPSATTPPLTNPVPHAGSKMAASLASIMAPNSDWLITPRLNLGDGSILKFYARSHTNLYGLERFKVGVSTLPTTITQGFVYISGDTYVEAPTEWTEFSYDLSAWDNQQVFIGIRCMSYDAFVFYVDDFSVHTHGGSPNTQQVSLSSGWNLVSLNVTPANPNLPDVLGSISDSVVQIKGTDGVYLAGNPYSSLTELSDGKAYSIQMNDAATWIVNGTPIPANTPIQLNYGWNLAAYLPQIGMQPTFALQNISPWLNQVKGADGVYIPGNPYSSLTTMYPGRGYWIQVSGTPQLIYPTRGDLAETKSSPGNLPQVVTKPFSMTLLARCDWANPGDILLAKSGDELRGAEELKDLEGFPATLIQIFCDDAGEEISLWIMKPDGSLLPVANRFVSQPNGILGEYPAFMELVKDSSYKDPVIANELIATFPNPFNQSTTITFGISEDDCPVRISVYNMKGQKISRLIDDNYDRGTYSAIWNAEGLGSGIYILEFTAGTNRQTARIVLSK